MGTDGKAWTGVSDWEDYEARVQNREWRDEAMEKEMEC